MDFFTTEPVGIKEVNTNDIRREIPGLDRSTLRRWVAQGFVRANKRKAQKRFTYTYPIEELPKIFLMYQQVLLGEHPKKAFEIAQIQIRILSKYGMVSGIELIEAVFSSEREVIDSCFGLIILILIGVMLNEDIKVDLKLKYFGKYFKPIVSELNRLQERVFHYNFFYSFFNERKKEVESILEKPDPLLEDLKIILQFLDQVKYLITMCNLWERREVKESPLSL